MIGFVDRHFKLGYIHPELLCHFVARLRSCTSVSRECAGAARRLVCEVAARRACDATRFARVETSTASRRAPVFAEAPVLRGEDDARALGDALERVCFRDAGLRAMPSPCLTAHALPRSVL